MRQLMTLIDKYVRNMAGQLAPDEDLPEIVFAPPRRSPGAPRGMYLCRNCGHRLSLDCFPEAKRLNPAVPVDCTACGGTDHRQYLCQVCGQVKLIGQFPEEKQRNTTLKMPCTYCDKRTIRFRDTKPKPRG